MPEKISVEIEKDFVTKSEKRLGSSGGRPHCYDREEKEMEILTRGNHAETLNILHTQRGGRPHNGAVAKVENNLFRAVLFYVGGEGKLRILWPR